MFSTNPVYYHFISTLHSTLLYRFGIDIDVESYDAQAVLLGPYCNCITACCQNNIDAMRSFTNQAITDLITPLLQFTPSSNELWVAVSDVCSQTIDFFSDYLGMQIQENLALSRTEVVMSNDFLPGGQKTIVVSVEPFSSITNTVQS
jgi:hypothetical protein